MGGRDMAYCLDGSQGKKESTEEMIPERNEDNFESVLSFTATRKKFAETKLTDRPKIWLWIIGCGIVSVAAHFLRLHWLEDTVGGLGILFIVAGTVTEIDDRIKAVEERAEKPERRLEEEKRGTWNTTGNTVELEGAKPRQSN